MAKIGIFATASALKEEDKIKIDDGIKLLQSWEHEVILAKNCFYSTPIFENNSESLMAGTIEQRIEGLYEIWEQADILLALRGGYGSIELIDKLDYDFFWENPRTIIGYSDITTLFCAIESQCKSFGTMFHAPMLFEISSLKPNELDAFKTLLTDPANYPRSTNHKVRGGNLSLIASLIGSKYLKHFSEGEILFLEEIKEPAYKIERLFYQIYHAGLLDPIEELWLGKGSEAVYNYSLLETFSQEKGFKLVKDLAYGHLEKMPLRFN
jgi:muramoyltetrapeptide carboxypeptidase